MIKGFIALAVSLCVCVFALADLRAQANRRTIYASVLDANGAPVQGVDPNDLIVREDKVVREVVEVWPATEPMDVALLVDNSQAADSFIRDYREALPAFINALAADESGAKHQVALITLADRPTIRSDYSPLLANVAKSAGSLFAMPGTGTYLLDGIIETSKGLSKRPSERRNIVVVTTEGAELSDRVYQSVLEPLHEAQAALHVVVVGRPVNNDNDRSVVLGMGTKDSGGSYSNILTSNGLTARMKKLADELTHQVKVVYGRPESLIPPDQITIASNKPGLTVRGTPAHVSTTVRERR